MKHPKSFRTTALCALLAVLVLPVLATSVHADPQADARAHYDAGSKAFAAGDYQKAIREFEAADRLAPAPVLDYNVALALEQLGQKRDALLRYRRYLDRDPRVANRTEVEGRIRTLTAEIDAEEARRAADAKAAEDAKRAADARAAEEARRAEDARRPVETAPEPALGPAAGSETGEPAPGAGAEPWNGPASSPGSAGASYAPTGDPALDRVAQVDIAAVGGSRGRGPASSTAPEMAPQTAPSAAPVPAAPDNDKPKAKPLYKQWWFWAVVGVSAIILIDIATTDSNSTSQPVRGGATGPNSAGATIFTF